MLCSSCCHSILTISSFSVKCELEKYYKQKIAVIRKEGRETMKRQMKVGNNPTLKKAPKSISVLFIKQRTSHCITAFSVSLGTTYYIMWKGKLGPRIKQNQHQLSFCDQGSQECGRYQGFFSMARFQEISPKLTACLCFSCADLAALWMKILPWMRWRVPVVVCWAVHHGNAVTLKGWNLQPDLCIVSHSWTSSIGI